MHIGIVTTWFERGAAIVSRAYMDVLSAEHDVHIYARGGERFARDSTKWNLPNVTWGRRLRGHLNTRVDSGHLQRWLKGNHIDIVLFNEQHSWDIILDLRRSCDVLLGAYIDYYTPRTVPFFNLYDFLLCNTRRHFHVFRDHPQTLYIPWGTDLNLFRPRAKENQGVVFFHSSGMSPDRKGTDVLIAVFRRIPGNCQLIIHLQPNRDHYAVLKRLAGDDPRIRLIEAEVGAPGLYHLGDVYVYPTLLEGIGLTIAEALASGLPVITTNEAPMNEFIIDGYNGKLVDIMRREPRWDGYYWPMARSSEEDLQKAMQFFMDRPESLPWFQAKARESAEILFNWKHNSRHLSPTLQRIKSLRGSLDPDLIRAVGEYEAQKSKIVHTTPKSHGDVLSPLNPLNVSGA